jgi:SAM-dependent methyltransferase
MRKHFYFVFFTLFYAVLAHAHVGCIKCLLHQAPYGVLATTAILDEMPLTEPKLSKTGKSLVTANQFGFDVADEQTLKDSWLIQEITTFSKHAEHPILDVGAGYGRLTKMMLSTGATVVYNDLEIKHLLYGRTLATPQEKARLYLNTFNFSQGMIFKPDTFSAVILHRVIHFMPPDQVEEGIAKIHRWLVPGGKVFIAVLPPQHSEYRTKVLAQYEAKWQAGNAWPGYGFKSQELLPEQSYALPQMLHVMDERPLVKALQKYGFTVEKKGFIEMKKFGKSNVRDGHELFGIVAKKA